MRILKARLFVHPKGKVLLDLLPQGTESQEFDV